MLVYNLKRISILALVISALAILIFSTPFDKDKNVYAEAEDPTSVEYIPASRNESIKGAYSGYCSEYVFNEGDKLRIYFGEEYKEFTYGYNPDIQRTDFFDADGGSLPTYDLYLKYRWAEGNDNAYFHIGEEHEIVVEIWDYYLKQKYCETTVTATIIKDPDYEPRVTINGIQYRVKNGENVACVNTTTGTITEAAIREQVTIEGTTYPVKYINNWAFAENPELTSVTIPSSIEEIKTGAFINTGIKDISIPASVREIGPRAIGYSAHHNLDDIMERYEEYEDFQLVPDFTMDVKTGSKAEEYARLNQIKYVDREAEEKKAAEEAAAKKAAEEKEAKNRAENEARIAAEEAAAKKANEETAKKNAEIIAKKKAREEAAKKAEEEAKEAARKIKASIKAAKKAKTKLKAKAIKNRKAKLTWKKNKNAAGYMIYLYDKKTAKYKKIKSIKKASITKWMTRKLAEGKKYFFRIRTLTKVNGKVYYGKWSNKVKVKVRN